MSFPAGSNQGAGGPESTAAKPDERELRFARVLLAADAFTRYPEDREESWHELCNACEAVTDEELEVLRGLA